MPLHPPLHPSSGGDSDCYRLKATLYEMSVAMKDTLLRIYHHLPAAMCSVAASLRGYYLRSWRYGPETERLAEEALEREGWSHEKWKTWQEERLAYVLHRAATKVPYYRDQWAKRRRSGDRAS